MIGPEAERSFESSFITTAENASHIVFLRKLLLKLASMWDVEQPKAPRVLIPTDKIEVSAAFPNR